MAPQMETATYIFNPQTGVVRIVEDSLIEPNGLSFSPDKKTLYLSDTGVAEVDISPYLNPPPGLVYNSTGKRTIYSYDVGSDGISLSNKQPIYLAMEYGPDGLKVAENGMIVTATGKGVDVLATDGTPLLRIQTNFTVVNIAFAGPQYNELWMVGVGQVGRVQWALTGAADL